MNKYPFVYFLRYNQYNAIDVFFEKNREKSQFTIEILSPTEIHKLNNMFSLYNQILITYGPNFESYLDLVSSIITKKMSNRWIHKQSITDIDEFNKNIKFCYVNNIVGLSQDTTDLELEKYFNLICKLVFKYDID